MQTLEDLGLDLDNRRPEEEVLGVVGRHSLPEGETGDRGTASEDTLVFDDEDDEESSSF